MVKWDDSKSKLLLLTVITVHDVKVTNWDKIADAMGPDYTASGVMQQYAKLKKECRETGVGSTTSTPVKKPRAKKANGETSTGKRSNTKVEAGSGDDEEGDILSPTPAKKMKMEKMTFKGAAKEDSEDEC